MPIKTTITKVLTIMLVNLIMLELASFAAVHALAVVGRNRRLDLFVDGQLADVTDAMLAEYLDGLYDAELGWDNVANRRVTRTNVLDEPWTASHDATGARRSCIQNEAAAEEPALVATFGDSFTRGDEVNDDETWQCEIERRIGRRVANYGVGGYDVGQALLKAQRQWSEGRVAPITILGVYSDDLGRVLSRYRPYQDGVSPGNAKFAFKPSFRYFDGDVEFLPNPLHGRITVPEVRELAISVAHTDYWAQGWARVLPDFPYSLQMLRTGSYAVQSRIRTPHYLTNIWNTDEGRAVMAHLLRRFATGAQHHQTHAVLLLIPDVNAWRDGRTAPAYADFVRRDLVPASLGLTIIDVAKTAFDERRFSLMPFEGHASLYGNTVIADTVLERLRPMLEAARSAGAHGQ